MGFSVEGRQCWLPAWPIGFSHLDTSRCRIDPALTTATSTIDLEHIWHIPAMILQASVGNILSAPRQHCRPIMNSGGHTPGTEQGKTQERTVRERGVILRTEGNQHRWREKIPLESSGDTTANKKNKNQCLRPRTKYSTHRILAKENSSEQPLKAVIPGPWCLLVLWK